ncbi:anaerobic ribonucleoside-triphosphate reductase activating protein [Oceanispirochaeta sp.]|jgi:pyruvate formate lyase activating enzyme|uniref:anaerobic ribonucleoside-triphosphate reductase activating protein n=1 Tax=Oceanispirochaeta sp. TaxID=2035350 RepID=UPI00262BC20E|nr:anaerobic ribonucleoside-triphosphate reductase activating protein [Oceanispirochaeta sp.]MDA3956512.1 anaerobic ribonucleoside-triphosphate reductase activating protein [Oceanispirochaeta sp.]
MHLPSSVGLQKTSLADYPGKVASVLFFPGCNLRCSYCHNPDLVLGRTEGFVRRDEVINFLKNRASLLGGVVISGGEPLLYKDLKLFMKEIQTSCHLPVKIDTNGLLSDRLQDLIQSDSPPDFIAMDIKTSLSSYDRFAVFQKDQSNIQDSIKMIIQSGIPSQFRTTVHPDFIDVSMIDEISGMIRGCTSYVLNSFQPGNCLDTAYNAHNPTDTMLLRELYKGFLEQGIPCSCVSLEYGSNSF